MSPIHYFDVIFLIGALVLVVLGMMRGLIGEVVRLFAVVGGLATGLLFYRPLYPLMKILNISPSAKVCIAFLLLFIAGFILVILAGWAAQKLVRLSMLDWVDRLGGGVFSFLKAVVIAWIFVRSVESSPFTYMQNNFRPSITYRLLAALPPKLVVPYFDRSGRSVGRLLGSDAVREVQKEFSNVRLKLDSARTVIDKPAQPKKPAKKQPPPARKRGE